MKIGKFIKELTRKIRKDKDDLSLRLELAAVYRRIGRRDDALAVYREVALVQRDRGRIDQAIAACESALELDGANVEIKALRAQLQAAVSATAPGAVEATGDRAAADAGPGEAGGGAAGADPRAFGAASGEQGLVAGDEERENWMPSLVARPPRASSDAGRGDGEGAVVESADSVSADSGSGASVSDAALLSAESSAESAAAAEPMPHNGAGASVRAASESGSFGREQPHRAAPSDRAGGGDGSHSSRRFSRSLLNPTPLPEPLPLHEAVVEDSDVFMPPDDPLDDPPDDPRFDSPRERPRDPSGPALDSSEESLPDMMQPGDITAVDSVADGLEGPGDEFDMTIPQGLYRSEDGDALVLRDSVPTNAVHEPVDTTRVPALPEAAEREATQRQAARTADDEPAQLYYEASRLPPEQSRRGHSATDDAPAGSGDGDGDGSSPREEAMDGVPAPAAAGTDDLCDSAVLAPAIAENDATVPVQMPIAPAERIGTGTQGGNRGADSDAGDAVASRDKAAIESEDD